MHLSFHLYPKGNFFYLVSSYTVRHYAQALLLIRRLVDELIPIYIVLRTPLIQASTLKSYLSRLAINLESYAISTASNTDAGEAYVPPAKELLSSEAIQDSYKPTVVSHKNGPSSRVYVIWKVNVFICTSTPQDMIQGRAINRARSPERKATEARNLPCSCSIAKTSRECQKRCT